MDTTKPVITAPDVTAEATGASGAAVTFSATATDNVDGNVTVSYSAVSGSTFAIGTTVVTATATDEAGNTATKEFNVTVKDTTGPVISAPADITAYATSTSGAVVTFNATATDIVDGAVAVTANPASGSTFPLGETTVTLKAVDSTGNPAAQKTFKVKVIYSWSGVLQPINWLPSASNPNISPYVVGKSSVSKAGSTIPVKFQLSGVSNAVKGGLVGTATLSVQQVSGNITEPVNEAAISTTPDAGSAFRYDALSDQYIFNWSTKGKAAGIYRLIITLGDGVTRYVEVGLRQ